MANKNIHYDARKEKWEATFKVNGKRKSLGFHDEYSDAEQAVENARQKYKKSKLEFKDA